jgi:hypothetical protein
MKNLTKKTKLKRTAVMMLATSMIFGAMSFTASAESENHYENIFITEEEQFNRLVDLKSISNLYNNYGIVPFFFFFFPNYMPNITFISSPSDSVDEMFNIGLEIYLEGLGYDDRHSEKMSELLNSIIPKETVDFILEFTSIPYEEANIFYSVFLETPLWPYNKPLPSDRVDIWEYYYSNRSFESFVNLNRNMRMGEVISITGIGNLTAGHPLNANGSSFFTAPHRASLNNTNVFVSSASARIGTIIRSIYNNRVDIAQVDVSVSNSTMSRQLPPPWNWPGGINITNFRGIPNNNQEVRTLGGFSGVMTGRISNSNASVGGLQNQVLVTPDLGRGGDSGAALIRLSDSAVLGTKRGAISVNGVWNMVYTNVQNY